MEIMIGIGEYAVSRNESNTMKTLALGSCVAVTAYSPLKKAAGMIHIALPSPGTQEDLLLRPSYYAASGIPLLIRTMNGRYGCLNGELIIQLFGGADSVNKNDLFNIGRRNIEAAVTVLAQMGLPVRKADVGGTVSRSIAMNVGTGVVETSIQNIII